MNLPNPLAWFRFDPTDNVAEIRLQLWPGSKDRLLARSGFHGSLCGRCSAEREVTTVGGRPVAWKLAQFKRTAKIVDSSTKVITLQIAGISVAWQRLFPHAG